MQLKYLYHYKTRVGTFWIASQPNAPGNFYLGVDDDILGPYYSPEAAADDVYSQSTSHYEWDAIDESVTSPCDLSEWIKGRPNDV